MVLRDLGMGKRSSAVSEFSIMAANSRICFLEADIFSDTAVWRLSCSM